MFVNEGDDEEEVFEAPNVGDVMLLVDDDDNEITSRQYLENALKNVE